MNSSGRYELHLRKDLQHLLDDHDGITQQTGGLVHVFSSSSYDESSSDHNDNPYELQVSMQGPPGSPYSEGIFMLYIQIPDDYPFQAPTIQFQTPIWHPNIGPHDGIVYLDVLTDGKWTPAWKLNTLLMAVFSILSDPLVDDHDAAINKEAAKLYRLNRYQYRRKAHDQTRIHACPQITTERQQYGMIESLAEMGFVNTEVTKRVLESKGWNIEEAALELLLMTEGATDPPPISSETQTIMTTQSSGEDEDTTTSSTTPLPLVLLAASSSSSQHVPTKTTGGEYEYNDDSEDEEDNDNIGGLEEEETAAEEAGARPITTTTPAILRVDDDDQEDKEDQPLEVEKKNDEKQENDLTSTSVGGGSFEDEYYLIGGCSSSSEDGTNSEGQSSASSFVLVDEDEEEDIFHDEPADGWEHVGNIV